MSRLFRPLPPSYRTEDARASYPLVWRRLGLRLLLGSLCVAFALAACSKPTPPNQNNNNRRPPPPPSENTLAQGIYKLTEKTDPWRLVVSRGTETLSELPKEGIQFGQVAEYEEKYNYDPYWLRERNGKSYTPPGLEWLKPKTITLESKTKTKWTFAIDYGKQKAQLTVENGKLEGTFLFQIKPQPADKTLTYTRLRWKVDKQENYYGLGEYFDQVAHRGMVRAMQIELNTKYESGYNEAHVPVPFFTGTKGWGLFIESYRPATFNMAADEDDILEITYHEQALKFYVFAAKHPLDVPGLYTQITGAPAVPARWSFGTLLWRDENKDQAEVLEDASEIRKNDLAISGLWIDRPYDTVVNNFRFDPKRYPDAPAMIQTLHNQGFRLGLWSTPYLAKGSEKRDEFLKNKWFVQMGFRALNKWSDPVDLTNPDAVTAWQALIQRMTDLGIEGFKLDYGEDIQIGLFASRTIYGFHNGDDERNMHHKYAIFYHKTYAKMLPKDGGFLLCRGSTFGGQKYASIIWPGDLDAGFQTHGQCEDGKKVNCYVGGLIASIIGGLTLSQSGFPFYGSDTGGYRHDRPNKEVFMRWGQQTALSTIMQIGGPDPNVNPWDFTKYKNSQFDKEVLNNFRKYIRLHTRLFPYNYTYAQAAHHHKRGAARPYGMAYPNENVHPNDQYMFGEYLLVAPVVQSQTQRKVRFPKGEQWLDWDNQTFYKGGQEVSVAAPLDKLPLFVRVGSIVPLLRPDVDTLAPVQDKTIISTHSSWGPLYARVVPGMDTAFTLFDNTKFELSGKNNPTLQITPGDEFQEGYVLEWMNLQKPNAVQRSGKELNQAKNREDFDKCDACWLWDKDKKQLKVRLPSGASTLTLQAKLQHP